MLSHSIKKRWCSLSNGGYLSRKKWIKNRIGFNQRYLEDLRQMKKTEKDSESGLEDGRRRWFNRDIENIEKLIENLSIELEQVEKQ